MSHKNRLRGSQGRPKALSGLDMVAGMQRIVSPFPYCCRYKERGVMFCHDGHDCTCDCHGRDAPPVKPRGGKEAIHGQG